MKWPKREIKRNPKNSSEHKEKENRNVNGESEKEKVSLDGKIIILGKKKVYTCQSFNFFKIPILSTASGHMSSF